MSKLSEYLNRHIVGNVFDAPAIRQAYATDRSLLEITPALVALPENPTDLRRLLRFVHQLSLRGLDLPVTPRGSGLDKTGAAIGSGLILSLERLNQIEEIDLRGRLVRVQPGLTLGRLNAALGLQGLWLPIAADPDSTIGGLIANSPVDAFSGRHGGIYRYVESVEVVLANGELIQLSPYRARAVEHKIASGSAEGQLYRAIGQILDEHADIILDRSMQPFDAAGYANITRVHENHTTNLLPLMFASQGTLAVISDIILRVEPSPTASTRLAVLFHDRRSAERFLAFAAERDPYLLQLCDSRILAEAAALGKTTRLFDKLGSGYLVLLGFDQRRAQNRRHLRACLEALPEGALYVEETPERAADFRDLDSVLLAYLNPADDGPASASPASTNATVGSTSVSTTAGSTSADTTGAHSTSRPVIFDNVMIPTANLEAFLDGLKVLEETLGLALPVFGSFVTSSYTVRPAFDLSDLGARKSLLDFCKLYGQLVATCQGSLTGNIPEGRTAILAGPARLGVGERQVYSAIKTAFDPQNILNPGLKLDATVKTALSCVRTGPLPGVTRP